MNHLYIFISGFTLCLLLGHRAVSQTSSLTDDDVVAIKMAAERSFSDYQRIMNELADPKMLSIYRDSVIAESEQIFTENARIEVDYDTSYLPPHIPYEVHVDKYLGDFYTYFQRNNAQNRVNIYFTNRRISDIQWHEEDKFYYLTIDYTSIYDNLPPQQRVATFKAEQVNGQWQTWITYIKFKDSPREQDAAAEKAIANARENPASRQQAPQEDESQDDVSVEGVAGQISLNKLAEGGKKGKQYMISWQMPESHPVSVLLLPDEGTPIPIATSHRANQLAWNIDREIKPGKYQIRVLDEQMMTSVTSPEFRINRRFPLGLQLAIGAGVGFYLVQTIRHDWNFAWPFGTQDTPEPVRQEEPEEPDLPEPPSVPE